MQDHRAQDPDPTQLRDYTGQVHQLLQSWQLLIATGHRAYANLLTLQLQQAQPLPPGLPQRLLAVCESCEALRAQVPADAANVLLLTEVSLKDGSVLPLLRELRERLNPPRIVVAMAEPLQPALARAAWRLGVDALICSDHYGTGELARGLEAVAQQRRYWGPAFAGLLMDDGPASDALSQRELEVLPLLAQGLTNRQIAARLQIAEVTAREKGLGGVMFWDLSNDAVGDPDSLIEAAADFWLDGRSFAEIAAASGLRFDAIVGGNGLFDLADVLQDPTAGGPALPVELQPQPVGPQPLPVVPQPEVLQPVQPTPLVPTPVEPTPAPTVSSGGIAVDLQLSSQWGGAFEGQLLLTNQGGQALSQWSVSFSSRYELRGLSDFSLQQSRQADGTWLVTLRPPSWGTTLQPGTTARSYVQGLIPGGGLLASLDPDLVLAAAGSVAPVQPEPIPTPSSTPTPVPVAPVVPAPVDPITGGGGSTSTGTAALAVDVLVGSSDTRLQARSDQAELFRLGYAWGRQLTIEGFKPGQDRLDLRGFWGEGQQARVLGSAEGVRVELPFNQQAVLLPGVRLDQWQPQALEVWAG